MPAVYGEPWRSDEQHFRPTRVLFGAALVQIARWAVRHGQGRGGAGDDAGRGHTGTINDAGKPLAAMLSKGQGEREQASTGTCSHMNRTTGVWHTLRDGPADGHERDGQTDLQPAVRYVCMLPAGKAQVV